MAELPQRFPLSSTAQISFAKIPTDCTGAEGDPRKGRRAPSAPAKAALNCESYGLAALGIPPHAPPALAQLSPDCDAVYGCPEAKLYTEETCQPPSTRASNPCCWR